MKAREDKPKLFNSRKEVERQAADMSPATKADFTNTGSHVGHATDHSSVYIVVAGDTLSSIALHFYGDGSATQKLLAVNRNQLRTPDDLKPGQALRIPAKL